MTVGVALLLYVACAGAFGPRALRRTSWTDRAPLPGIVIYLAAVWSVIAAAGLAGLTLAVHATALGGGLSHLIGACVLRLRATYATPGGATMAGLGLTLAGAVAARTAVTAVGHLRATGRQALRQAHTARLAGVPQPALGAVLLEHPQPAAYCVACRQPTVVLTTGALQALSPDQLEAVLAHERAHLTGHHHRLLALARIGRQILPFLPLMSDADVQVARLIELHADDAATSSATSSTVNGASVSVTAPYRPRSARRTATSCTAGDRTVPMIVSPMPRAAAPTWASRSREATSAQCRSSSTTPSGPIAISASLIRASAARSDGPTADPAGIT